MAIEYSIVVDEKDNIIKYKPRKDLLKSERIRIAAIWIEDDKGNVLIHQRHTSKSYPLCWENAAGGGVSRGESYESAAYKELEEEIGLKDIKLEFVTKNIVITKGGERYCGWFKGVCKWSVDKFKLEENCVQQVMWINKQELLNWRDKEPDKFMPSSKYWRELFS